jgi:hypothetical protein
MDPALPTPKDHAEAVAVFRAQIIGPALARSLSRGELATLLRELASKEYVPPRAKRRHHFGTSTLERWYSAVCFVMRSGRRSHRTARRDSWKGTPHYGGWVPSGSRPRCMRPAA